MNGKITRRRMLRTSAATGVGLFAAGSGFPVLGQDNQNLDLPQGAAGKLTVIHRTEYFEEAQNLFRETVAEFAAANNVELDISTTNPEVVRRLPRQDDGGGEGRQSARLRLHQQRLDLADAPARPASRT